jgi:hypothetical protein
MSCTVFRLVHCQQGCFTSDGLVTGLDSLTFDLCANGPVRYFTSLDEAIHVAGENRGSVAQAARLMTHLAPAMSLTRLHLTVNLTFSYTFLVLSLITIATFLQGMQYTRFQECASAIVGCTQRRTVKSLWILRANRQFSLELNFKVFERRPTAQDYEISRGGVKTVSKTHVSSCAHTGKHSQNLGTKFHKHPERSLVVYVATRR